MAVALSPGWLDRFVNELNSDEIKVYMHLGISAQPRTFAPLPDPPRFAGKKGDSMDPAADTKRFKAALGGLRLKDLVELDAEQRFRLPYVSSAGTHEAERQVPSAKERQELWLEMQRELYGATRTGPRPESFLAVLEILARYVPRLDEGVAALQREGNDKALQLYDELQSTDRTAAQRRIREALDAVALTPATAGEVAHGILQEQPVAPAFVWEEIAARLASMPAPEGAGQPALGTDELQAKWREFLGRIFPAFAGRPTRVNFVRLASMAFFFATNRLPAGDPEELFAELREDTGARFQELLDEYVARARDAVETDAARTVPDGDLLAGKAWEHAKRLAAKHEVSVEVVMDHLAAREEEARNTALHAEFDVAGFAAPDISGLSKEEGEMAWIDAVVTSAQQKEEFTFVLRRLRKAKRGYLERAIMAYCHSIIDLLEEHGMLENPTDEILDNIVATINEQTAYFRDQYFALTVDPIEAEDVRRVLLDLAQRKKAPK